MRSGYPPQIPFTDEWGVDGGMAQQNRSVLLKVLKGVGPGDWCGRNSEQFRITRHDRQSAPSKAASVGRDSGNDTLFLRALKPINPNRLWFEPWPGVQVSVRHARPLLLG